MSMNSSKADSPAVSVVICTYNRASSLQDTLKSLTAQQVGARTSFNIIVVDNNSRDHTAELVEAAAKTSPFPMRRVVETQQGIGWARNRGLEEAQGDYIFFIDDDAVAAPDWISKMTAAMEASGADFMGGRITPLWMTEKPSWLVDNLCGPIVRQDYGPERRPVKAHEGFLTANVVFRKKSIEKFGKFNPVLGRKGDRWIGGEDFELFTRWFHQGAKIYYEPSGVVQHKVEPQRVTPEFYRKWFVDIGYTQGHQMEWKNHYRWLILPVWRWKLLLKSFVEFLASGFKGSADEKFQKEIWWRFQSSFFAERAAHWLSHWKGGSPEDCEFLKVAKS
jgi:glucosyl-dolichyl phosphate glucuronosyltransferase